MSFLNQAIELLEKGLSIIPVNIDKKPLIKWEAYQHKIATCEDLETWWDRWPDANIGIVTGAISGLVVVDSDGPEGTEWINRHLPRTAIYARTAKGVHAYFRHPGGKVPNKSRIGPYVDVRGDGGYVVAPPSKHASGASYEWIYVEGYEGFDDLADYKIDSEPNAGSGIDLSAIRPPLSVAEGVGKGSRNQSLAELCGRWVGRGMEFDEILILAQAWNNQNSPPLKDAELVTTIRSIMKAHIRNHGMENVDEAEAEPDIMAISDYAFPDACLHPGGILEELMDYVLQSSAVSHPVFNLAGCIPALGSLIGHRVASQTGLRTNFYTVALGYSGSGKDAPQSAIPDLFIKTDASELMGPNELTSDAALLKHLNAEPLSQRPRTCLYIDEFGLILTAMRRPSSPAYSLPTCLMKLFSSVNRSYRKSKAEEEFVIRWHHVGLYGASTPDRFWKTFSKADSADGFLARLLIFNSSHNSIKSKRPSESGPPKSLISAINKIWKTDPRRGGNLEAIPSPKIIPLGPGAGAMFDEYENMIMEQRDIFNRSDDGCASICARACEHAQKLALLHAVSMEGLKATKIGKASMEWAIAVTEHTRQMTISEITENLPDTDFHGDQLKIIRVIRKKATQDRPGATMREIRQFVRIPTKILDDSIKSLIESGEICIMKRQGSRGPSTEIFCIRKNV